MTAAEAQSIQVPLDEFVREMAREAAEVAWARHIAACPVGALQERVRKIELDFARLVGLLLGSGVLGGAVGGFLMHLLKL